MSGDAWDRPRSPVRGAAKFRNEAGINLGNSPTPAPGTANLVFCKWFRIQIVLAAIDRRAGKARAPNCIPAISNGAFVDHPTRVRPFAEIRNPSKPSHKDARQQSAIQLLFGGFLAYDFEQVVW